MQAIFSHWKTYVIFISFLVITGCARDIQMNPDLTRLRQVEPSSVIDKNVAYFISAENKEKKVVTPGGGGDKVTYKPYADSEGALITVLSKIFTRVYSIDSLDNMTFINDKGISYIFIPEITTNSSSSSAFTWPPTEFTISLACKAVDSKGLTVWEKTLQSKGNAEYSEFKSDFSLAARRASEALFLDLLKEINKAGHTFN
ncbi:hypothetical protein FXF61_14070 [Pseudomonas sp. C27(2019)]|uniref:hypothetical protein n=1 Tax=Pseudomonas sp. C27(2019) TaxID=2604941 RepID=UPI001245EC84|nr:hypothetical protein [Pseudomonas sp. C27(2019)]QEY60196.1 hypothetical protein FXF61_14070 [Pseudomonas sp. C27(2019)]